MCLTALGGILIGMETYKTYRTISGTSEQELDKNVTEALSQGGWQLYGDPYISPNGVFYQAMLKVKSS